MAAKSKKRTKETVLSELAERVARLKKRVREIPEEARRGAKKLLKRAQRRKRAIVTPKRKTAKKT